ncbi:hypothetical protein C8Q77DRAFT_1080451 [Trametes polyzona]|nr:hypothetical protein C8Q77DRAFT_1080451 [Trametes polyzona]
MSGADLPPTYTQEPSESDAPLSSDSSDISFVSAPDMPGDPGPASNGSVGPQIIIVPAADGVHFQKGFLGADGERAAIEGELQIKSADASFRWRKVMVSLRTVEQAHGHEIELAHTDVELAGSSEAHGSQQRSSFPFSIPLPPDTPQCLHTIRSSLTHTLSATIWPLEEDAPALSRAFVVHTRRYTSHTHVLYPVPETRVLEEPSRVEVQVPRTTFKAGEPIPIYVTVPTPAPELVLEQGLRLRNLRAELVRSITIRKVNGDVDAESPSESEGDGLPVSPQKMTAVPSSSREGIDFQSRLGEHGERKVVALSGASCRLHPSQPIRVRLVLHPPSQSPLPDSPNQLSSEDLFVYDPDADCATITQSTLLHSVSFRLLVHATFMNMTTHTERVSTLSFPLQILPPNAPLPEVESSIDEAYHKKHDRPPTRTVRQDDAEVPQYEAGPSAIAGAPPPFEEREAPPPFWSTEAEAEAEASTSTRLPTFLESEHEIYVPSDEDPTLAPPPPPPPADGAVVFDGEGTLFGFLPSAQFDGYADVLPPRACTPPPTLEMATRDTDVTGLANMDMDTGAAAIEALGLALEQQALAGAGPSGVGVDEHLLPPPPPPPPMDDPSDPPPSIDSSDFRAPGAAHPHPHPHDSPPTLPVRAQSPHASFGQLTEQPVHGVLSAHGHGHDDEGESHGHAPPPYRVPDLESEHERVVHPPPYMDLVHAPQ